MCDAQLNYPVHEKELLAIVHMPKKWHVELLGTPFTIYTDHHTLENFMMQCNLSCQQAHWQEFFVQYNFTIQYIPGEENMVTDALSQLPPDDKDMSTYPQQTINIPTTQVNMKPVALVLSIMSDPFLLADIKSGYNSDTWCMHLMQLIGSLPGLQHRDDLLYLNDCLVIPRIAHLRKTIFWLAHDDLGHTCLDKSYAAIQDYFYWLNMCHNLENSYIPACTKCVRNKSRTIASSPGA